MKTIVTTSSAVVTAEVIGHIMVATKEIVGFKRAMAELQLQRDHMLEQANIAREQLKAQLSTDLERTKSISQGFQQVLQQNSLLVQQHADAAKGNQHLCAQLLQVMQSADINSLSIYMSAWQDLIKQTELNRQQATQLQQQLMDAYQQFGITVSHRDQSWQTVG